MHHRDENQTTQDREKIIELFSGEKEFPDQIIGIEIIEGN
jgi:hypothetical protein